MALLLQYWHPQGVTREEGNSTPALDQGVPALEVSQALLVKAIQVVLFPGGLRGPDEERIKVLPGYTTTGATDSCPAIRL
uniref:Uncharacterized protein n=1 Tax=Amphimedon queenslandica TaxID=400682 RepID=A0A1X7SFD6_AMPQE